MRAGTMKLQQVSNMAKLGTSDFYKNLKSLGKKMKDQNAHLVPGPKPRPRELRQVKS